MKALSPLLPKHAFRTFLFSSCLALVFTVVPESRSQITTTLPQWAVIDFANTSGIGGPTLGGTAADAVATLLAGTNKANVVPRETVERAYTDLGLQPPVTRHLDILKLGQFLQVETVFVGEVTQARVNTGGNGKSADIVMEVRGIDVASGLAVYGAAVYGQSSERPGDVSDDTLLAEAVDYAAQQVVSKVLSQQIGYAYVLATPGKALRLNKGSREGIKQGMELVVTRGKEMVAVIRVTSVSPDQCEATVARSVKGVAPGDKARPIYDKLDTVVLTSRGPKIRTVKRMDVTNSLVGLLVVGLGATLVAKENMEFGPGEFITEADLTASGAPAVRCSWSPNIFTGSVNNKVEWQIFRHDLDGIDLNDDGIFPDPALVAQANETTILNTGVGFTGSYRNLDAFVGGPACIEDPGGTEFSAPGIISGITYLYRIRLIYKLSSLDVPGAGGGDVVDCYFQTGFEYAKGNATPLDRTIPTFPANGAQDVPNETEFCWQAVESATDYAVEISTSPAFNNPSQVVMVAFKQTTAVPPGTELCTDEPIDISNVFPGVTKLYWRVGARVAGDVPGPRPDIIGQRFVPGVVAQFERVEEPPPPPGPQKNPMTPKPGGKRPPKGKPDDRKPGGTPKKYR